MKSLSKPKHCHTTVYTDEKLRTELNDLHVFCKKHGLNMFKYDLYNALLADALERVTYRFEGATDESIVRDVFALVGNYYSNYSIGDD